MGGDGGGKIFALCMIWGFRTKITPLDGKIFARCIPNGILHGKTNTWGSILAMISFI